MQSKTTGHDRLWFFRWRDLDLDQMTLIYDVGPYLLKMYEYTKVEPLGYGLRKLLYDNYGALQWCHLADPVETFY